MVLAAISAWPRGEAERIAGVIQKTIRSMYFGACCKRKQRGPRPPVPGTGAAKGQVVAVLPTR
jgi:hypothetical protein